MKLTEYREKRKPVLPTTLSAAQEKPSQGRVSHKKKPAPKAVSLPQVPRDLPWRKGLRPVIAALEPAFMAGFAGRETVWRAVYDLTCPLDRDDIPERRRATFAARVTVLKKVIARCPALRDDAALLAAIAQLEQKGTK